MAMQAGGIRLRRMGIGDILDETFRLWRRHFLTFATAMAIVEVPTPLISALVTIGLPGPEPSRGASPRDMVNIMASGGLVGLLTGLGSLVSGLAIIRLAADAVLGRPLDMGAAY